MYLYIFNSTNFIISQLLIQLQFDGIGDISFYADIIFFQIHVF